MYKGELVDLEYEEDNVNEPVFDVEPYWYLELDLLSMALE